MSARKGQRAPSRDGFTSRLGNGPDGFLWRGIEFAAPTEPGGMYSSEPILVSEEDGRSADWKFHQPKTLWHARLRIGADRYPGVGATPAEALEMAAAEAQSVAAFIVAMLPASSPPAPRKKRPRRAIKVRR